MGATTRLFGGRSELMRRSAIFAALVVTVITPAITLQTAAPARASSVARAPELVAFRGFHLHLGGGIGRRRVGFGGFGRRGRSGLGRRLVHALAFAYFLHLFFSHGGLSLVLWLVVIGLVVHFLRRRRRRPAY